MTRVLLQSLVVIVGITLGGVAGGYMTFHRYARDYALVRAFAWAGIFGAVAENQFNQNSSDAKQELLYALEIYSPGVQSSSIDPIMNKALRMKRGLTEARLSVLESEAGNSGPAKLYLSKALEDLKAAGWVNPTDATILQAVKRQPAPPCGVAPQNVVKTNSLTHQKPCG